MRAQVNSFLHYFGFFKYVTGEMWIIPFACPDENGAVETIREEIKNIFKKHIDKVREM